MTTVELRIAAMVGIVLVGVLAVVVALAASAALHAMRAAWLPARGAHGVPRPHAPLSLDRVARSRQSIGSARC